MLNIWQNDKTLSDRIGMEVSDKTPGPNPYLREELLKKIKGLLNSTRHEGRIQVYTHCYDTCSNYSLYLYQLKNQLEYETNTSQILQNLSQRIDDLGTQQKELNSTGESLVNLGITALIIICSVISIILLVILIFRGKNRFKTMAKFHKGELGY